MPISRLRFLVAASLATALSGCSFPVDQVTSKIMGRETYTMSSEGMEPTIKKGSRVTARTVDGDYVPKTGDIVVFDASKWGVNGFIIQRVIGVPGSTVQCCDPQGRHLLDGRPMDETHLYPNDYREPFGPLTIPTGRLWLEGDHRRISLDSRYRHEELGDGTIPVSDVIGVVELDG